MGSILQLLTNDTISELFLCQRSQVDLLLGLQVLQLTAAPVTVMSRSLLDTGISTGGGDNINSGTQCNGTFCLRHSTVGMLTIIILMPYSTSWHFWCNSVIILSWEICRSQQQLLRQPDAHHQQRARLQRRQPAKLLRPERLCHPERRRRHLHPVPGALTRASNELLCEAAHTSFVSSPKHNSTFATRPCGAHTPAPAEGNV